MPDPLPIEATLRKFLIVDDHAGFRRTLREFLPPGEVVECADGRDAVRFYTRERPDWVLMDIEMPGLDGFSATRQLQESFPAARVIVVSEHAGEEIRKAASAFGACGYVHKENLRDLRALFATFEPGRHSSLSNLGPLSPPLICS